MVNLDPIKRDNEEDSTSRVDLKIPCLLMGNLIFWSVVIIIIIKSCV